VHLPLTGVGVVDRIITDLRPGAPMLLVELAPGVGVDEVRERTGAAITTEGTPKTIAL
jgi:3-oxoacid CoA-transferase subunit B